MNLPSGIFKKAQAGITMALLLCMLVSGARAQQECGFARDSCVIPPANIKQPVSLLDATIKNNYHIQLIQAGQKQFMKITVTDNLGFGKTAPLLLKSGTKQMYFKSVTLGIIDPGHACFMLELYPNYLLTIKDFGLTNIIFNNNMEFVVPKADSDSIKLLAKCFYSLTNRN